MSGCPNPGILDRVRVPAAPSLCNCLFFFLNCQTPLYHLTFAKVVLFALWTVWKNDDRVKCVCTRGAGERATHTVSFSSRSFPKGHLQEGSAISGVVVTTTVEMLNALEKGVCICTGVSTTELQRRRLNRLETGSGRDQKECKGKVALRAISEHPHPQSRGGEYSHSIQ